MRREGRGGEGREEGGREGEGQKRRRRRSEGEGVLNFSHTLYSGSQPLFHGSHLVIFSIAKYRYKVLHSLRA